MSAARRPGGRISWLWHALLVIAVLAGSQATATAAPAHPLGNFTVSHYHGLTLTPERLEVLTVIDSAEIPTQQERPAIDADDDGELSEAELTARAEVLCPEVRESVTAEVDGVPLTWQAGSATDGTVPGAAGLLTLRMTCRFGADAPLDKPASLTFTDDYRTDRIGWHEITATGQGVRLPGSPVPSISVSDELRSYPENLLSSPLDVRTVTLATEPGQAEPAAAADAGIPGFTGDDPFSRLVTAGDRQLDAMVGDREMTPVIGGLAVLLAVLLGAGHAVLPGHGKTVMAAYLAGRRGRPRDAIIVGATVTGTHTIGVLVLGLLLTVSTLIAGEQALRILGIISGLLIALIGVVLLRDALPLLRALRGRRTEVTPEAVLAHHHSHSHDHDHGRGHGHGHSHGHHDHHGHDHGTGHGQGHSHGHGDLHDHDHGTGHGHSHSHASGRRGLIGMGVAGGLVPSPSALVVLLGAVALGRTVFGVLLVLAYGIGMAATLTAVGLLLVRLRGRLDRLPSGGRRGQLAARVVAALPAVTAALVLVVGVGLVARGVLFSV